MEDKKPTLRLNNTVTRRTVPMTERGCDMLRALREHKRKQLVEEMGVEYDIPFPTMIHLIIKDQYEALNLENGNGESSATKGD